MSSIQGLTALRETPARFTAEEFMQLAEHPPIANWIGKTELVNGEIVRMSPANVPHWNAQRIVFMRLLDAIGNQASEWIVGTEPTIRLSSDTIREPDVAVLRDPDLKATIFDGTALFLAIEIADSSLAIDLGEKKRDYASAFVPHYWVVNVNARQTTVMHTPQGGDYRSKKMVPFGEPIAFEPLSIEIVID